MRSTLAIALAALLSFGIVVVGTGIDSAFAAEGKEGGKREAPPPSLPSAANALSMPVPTTTMPKDRRAASAIARVERTITSPA